MTVAQALPTYRYALASPDPAEQELAAFDATEPARGARFLDVSADTAPDYLPRHLGDALATFPDPADYAARRAAPGLPLSAPPANHVPRRLRRKVDPARLMR